MKLGKLKLDIKEGIKREWIISNGIGGFASSTIIGANIRKYHGLLIAALNPPTNRYLTEQSWPIEDDEGALSDPFA